MSASLLALLTSGCSEGPENRPPQVVLSPDGPQLSYSVGDTVLIKVLAQDPDADALTFRYTARTLNTLSTLSRTATFIPTAREATLSWTPDSPDVTSAADPLELIFIVKDSRGAEVQRKLTLTITPGNGSPRFESSANQIYRSCCEEPLTFEVRARDDDSPQVTLRMSEAPEGAQFEQTGDKKGRFTWTPNPAQAQQRLHTASFVVSDGQNPAVTQDVTIVIYSGSTDPTPAMQGDICRGEQAITHMALRPQRGPSVREFPITATLSNQAAARYDRAAISWTATRDPVRDPSAALSTVDLSVDGRSLAGSFVNIAPMDGRDLNVFYKLCLIDTDAAANDPDGVLCAPARDNFYYSFRAYAKADGQCMDATPNDSFERAQNVSTSEWSFYQVCAANRDYHALTVRPGQKVALMATWSKGAPLQLKLYDQDRREVSNRLSVSDCTGYAVAELTGPAAGQPVTYYLEAAGDDITYHVSALELQAGQQVQCPDDALEPNNTAARASALKKGATVSGLAICPDGGDKDLYTVELEAGDRLEVTMNHPSRSANLDLELYSPSQRPDEVGKIGAGVAYTFSIGQDDETLTHDARQCGAYRLMVFSNDGPADYSLTANVTKAACQDDDEFKCNHQLSRASLFAWDKAYRLKLCDGGEDWLRHKGNQASILAEVKVLSGDASGVTFEVYDLSGTRVAQGKRNGSSWDLEATFRDDDFYYFRVASKTAITYEIFVAAL